MIRFSCAFLLLFACAVDHGGLNSGDTGVTTGCTADSDCDDGIACTADSCDSDLCVNTADDALCAVGERCAPTERGCVRVGACIDSECAENMRIPEQCRFGECVGDACVPNSGCPAGESCCGGERGDCTSCDDGNPCTVDSCRSGCDPTMDGADCCLHDPAPLTGTVCDDGLFCTTGDACNPSGVCEGTGPSSCEEICDEPTDACLGCRTDDGCPNRDRGDPSACRRPRGAPVCALAGERDQPIFVGRCIEFVCDYTEEDTETVACTLSPAGNSCAPDATTNDGPCATSSGGCRGTRPATLSTFACSAAGACVEATSGIRVDCDISAGTTCTGAPRVVDRGDCSYPNNCTRNGTRTDTVNLRECNGSGTCGFASENTMVTEMCMRGDRDGRSCAPTTPGACARAAMTECEGSRRVGSLCSGGSCDTDMPDLEVCDIDSGTSCGRVPDGAAFCDVAPGECTGTMRQNFRVRECDGSGGCADARMETEDMGECTLAAGEVCDDGDSCTTDICSSSGDCEGTEITCAPSDCDPECPGMSATCQCIAATGTCGCD